MKKFLSALLILTLISGCFTVSRAEEHSPIMEVYKCNEYVSLRETPDTQSKRLSKVYLGALVYYCAEAEAGFCLVEYNGKQGYILSKYLKDTDFDSNSVIMPNQQVYNCSEWVSLREDPDAKSDRLVKVPLGAVVTRCLIADEGWMYCTYKGKSGYIKKSYLKTADYDKIKKEEEARKKAEEEAAANYPKGYIDCMQVVNAESWVSLRESPSTDSKRLMQIPAGEYVDTCLYVNANWVHVSYEGQQGYVSAKYLAVAERPEPEHTGFDKLPALPSYADFMAAGNLVCEGTLGSYRVIARRAYNEEKEELLAVCYDGANRPLWTAFEESPEIGQVDGTAAFIGGTPASPYLVTFCSDKGFTARAIDGKGTKLWFTDCGNIGPENLNMLPGGGLTAAVDENGTIYAAGFFNEAPIAIDVNGNFLWSGVNPDPINIYWPFEITPAGASVTVLYDSCVEEEDMVYAVTLNAKTGGYPTYVKIPYVNPYYEDGDIYG